MVMVRKSRFSYQHQRSYLRILLPQQTLHIRILPRTTQNRPWPAKKVKASQALFGSEGRQLIDLRVHRTMTSGCCSMIFDRQAPNICLSASSERCLRIAGLHRRRSYAVMRGCCCTAVIALV